MTADSTPHDNSTKHYWQSLCRGDCEAFRIVVEKTYKPLFYYGTKFTDDREMIMDCIQDLFLGIWENRENGSHIKNPQSYLFQAFRNNLLHRLKQSARTTAISSQDTLEISESSSEADWIHHETTTLLNKKLDHAIAMLPKRQREALYLRYYEGLTYEEIGDIMGLNRQAVANYLQYGISKLRRYWQQLVTILFPVFLG